MQLRILIPAVIAAAGLSGAMIASAAPPKKGFDAEIARSAQAMLDEGRKTFRYETFGSEAFWGDALQLHKAIAGEKNGGVGPGVSPKTALSVGLKVDSDALPDALKQQIKAGKVNLDDPATTIALLKLNAVVGVTAFANPDGSVRSMGIQCAFCHSTVDNSFAPGIGRRLDGWANRDLNVGAIVSLAPNLKPFTDLLGVDVATLKTVLASWGPGCFDAELDKAMGASTRARQNAAKKSSMARANVRAAMCRRFSRSRGTTFMLRARSVWILSKRTALRHTCTVHLHLPDSGATRMAGSIMTAGSRLCRMSLNTTTES